MTLEFKEKELGISEANMKLKAEAEKLKSEKFE